MTSRQTLRDMILEDIQDDYLSLSWLDTLAQQATNERDAEERMMIILSVVKQLLDEHRVYAGFPIDGGNRFRVMDGDSKAIVDRIWSEWKALDRELMPGDVIWLARPELVDS